MLLLFWLLLLATVFGKRLAGQNDRLIAALRRSFLPRRFCARRLLMGSLRSRRTLIAFPTATASATTTASTPTARPVILSFRRALGSLWCLLFRVSIGFGARLTDGFGQLAGVALVEVVRDDEWSAITV